MPGSTWRFTSRNTQRKSRRWPLSHRAKSSIWSWNNGSVRSDRNRFQTCSARTVPLGKVGKVHLELLEHHVADDEEGERTEHSRGQYRPLGTEAQEHRVPGVGDDRG